MMSTGDDKASLTLAPTPFRTIFYLDRGSFFYTLADLMCRAVDV